MTVRVGPQREAAPGDAGHQPVAGPRAEAGADVEAAADADRGDAGDERRDLRGQAVHGREHAPGHVDEDADQAGVEDRADARPDAQRPPHRQHDAADAAG